MPHVPLRVVDEVGSLKAVLVSGPGKEFSNIPPDQLKHFLTEDVLWLDRAREQHEAFKRAIVTLTAGASPANAATVIDLREQLRLALGTCGRDGQERLCQEVVAAEDGLKGPVRKAAIEALSKLEDLDRLVDVLLGGLPGKSLVPSYPIFDLKPSPNMLFTRDYQFVLGSAVFISSMEKPARRREPRLARFIFQNALGVAPDRIIDLGRHEEGAHTEGGVEPRPVYPYANVEGGDVMAVSEDTILVGIGERTNRIGAAALATELRLLRAKYETEFPFRRILAVNIPARRAMMHLDTVFTLLDHRVALAFPPLTFPNAREEMNVDSCDLVDAGPGQEVRWKAEGRFAEVIGRFLPSLAMVAVGGNRRTSQHREQWSDGCNAFAVAPGVALAYSRNRGTLDTLERLDSLAKTDPDRVCVLPGDQPPNLLDPFSVKSLDGLPEGPPAKRLIVTIDGGELGRARGGPHCMTMALHRAKGLG